MNRKLRYAILLVCLTLFTHGCVLSNIYCKTHVIKTYPENGATNIKPGKTKIVFVFNKNISENYWGIHTLEAPPIPESEFELGFDNFPEVKENYLTSEQILKPNSNYVFEVGGKDSSPFLDENGNSIKSYRLQFSTGE